MRLIVIRLALLVMMLACGASMYGAVELPFIQAQQNAQNRFGANLLDLCKTATKTRKGALPAEARIAVIDSDKRIVYGAYEDALPDDLRATDKSDVNVVFCLSENKTVFDTDEYGTPTKYTCTRYERDLVGYVIDIQTGKTLNYHTFDGQTPPECPDKTDSDISRTGDTPDPLDVITWLTRTAQDRA